MGQELELTDTSFGELESSLDLLGDGAAMRERMQAEGYLYLPGYLGREAVLEARQVILERLDGAGWLDTEYRVADGIAAPAGPVNARPELVHGNEPLQRLLYSEAGPMMQFYKEFLGGDVAHFDYTWMRALFPAKGTPPHCDIVYMSRGTTNLFTSWTPLGDVPYEVGGLMILERSHLHERLRNTYGRKDVDEYCTNRRDAVPDGDGGGGNITQGGWLSKDPIKLRQNLGGRWLSTEYSAGDLLVFTAYTVHASIDNHSNFIRLSSDSRYQLAAEPIDERWMGDDPIGRRNSYKRGRIC